MGPHMIKRYYYDRDAKSCKEFIYHGKKGNANNFLSMEDCELVCQGTLSQSVFITLRSMWTT